MPFHSASSADYDSKGQFPMNMKAKVAAIKRQKQVPGEVHAAEDLQVAAMEGKKW